MATLQTTSITGSLSATGELFTVSNLAKTHEGNVEAYYQLSKRLQAFNHLGSTTVLEIEAITLAGGYSGQVERTTWRLQSRGQLNVTRHDENGGASYVTLKILNDTSVADANGQNAKYVVGLICGTGSNYRMVYLRARFLEYDSTSRWVTIAQMATATPTTVSGSAMIYSSGWVANTGYTDTSFTEVIVLEKASQLTLTATNGTAPLVVSSTTLVSNLNAQYLNGQLDSYYLNAANLTGTISGDRGVTAGSSSVSFVEYNGTTATAGQFDGGSTAPSGTTRLNYGGYLYASRLYAPIFYDTDNVNYYLDPASTSNLVGLTVANTISGSISGNAATATTSTRLSDATGSLRIANPGGAAYGTSSSSVTGAIKIKLPTAAYQSSTMMRFTVRIYEYAGSSSGTSRTLEIGGYNYSDGQWYNFFATQNTMGGGEINVRFGNDGASNCVWIGNTDTVWAYPQVSVTDFQAGYFNYTTAIWSTGWTISFITTFDTVTNGPIIAAKPLNSQNYSAYSSFSGVIKGDAGANYPHSFTNTDSGNTHWTNRNDRLLTSNGTNWATDGRDPIMALVTSGNSNATTIANSIGLTLHNESQTNNTFSPAITFSNRSNSGNYNSVYAAIIGKKTGQGFDSNWSAGELHFYTMPVGAYENDVPSLLINSAGNVGIGTTNPATLFQIGTGTPTSATGGLQFGDDTGTRIYRSASNTLTMGGTFVATTFSGALSGNATSSTATNDILPTSWSVGIIEEASVKPFLFNTLGDALAFQTISNLQYWDGSAWQSYTNSSIQEILTGNIQTASATVTPTNRKFRFEFTGAGAYIGGGVLVVHQVWSNGAHQLSSLLEYWNGISWVTVITERSSTGGGGENDYHFYNRGNIHGNWTQYRVTITSADTVNNTVYTGIQLLYDYTRQSLPNNFLPFSWDYRRNISINGTTVQNSASNRGNITLNGQSAILNFSISSADAGYLYHDGTNILLNNKIAGYLAFHTNNLERIRILSGGNVGIGTTNPAALLQVGTGTPTSATGGLQFGDDTGTRIYRSASSTLTMGGTFAATTFSGSGASLTNLPAGQLSGTIPSGVLVNSTFYIGTTAIALNRSSAGQTLTGISIDGNSVSAGRVGSWDGTTYYAGANSIGSSGGRNVNLAPNTYNQSISFEFKYDTFSPAEILGNYGGLITIAPWLGTTASTGDPNYQLLISPAAANSTNAPTIYLRAGIDTTWGSWVTMLHSGNYSSYALPLTGGTLTGNSGVLLAGANDARFDIRSNTAGAWLDIRSEANGYAAVNLYGGGATTGMWSAGMSGGSSAYRITTGAQGAGSEVMVMNRSTLATTFSTSVSSPIFYDSNDTNYYLDAANTGTSLSINNRIVFNTDTNLYRNSADVLKTDDSLIINSKCAVATSISATYTVDINGSLHYTSASASSDARFKKNIEPINDALIKLNNVRGVKFEWNEFVNARRNGYELNKPTLGVIAQELEAVFPELVDHWHLSDDCPDARAVNYEKIIPVLIEAVKELNNKNIQLEARLSALESKLQ